MNPLYNFGINVLAFGARIASHRSPKIKKMLEGQHQTLAALRHKRMAVAPDGFDVWFHAASLGEFEQARPIIERLRRNYPEKKMLLTFFSPSGYEIRSNYDKVDCVAYLPFDRPKSVKRFLDAAAPKMAIFSKYEFWGNYLEQLHRSATPTYIISSIFRPRQRFFRPWGGMFRKMLCCYTHLYVQDKASVDLLASIGVHNVTAAGDTRFDRVSEILASSRRIPEIESFIGPSRFTLIAGSSWQPDEDIYIPWLKGHPDVKAIIAPHEFDHARLESLRHRLGSSKTRLLSEIRGDGNRHNSLENVRYLIIDCFGLLSSLYRYGNVAVIGGGFGAGIHNINEAAVYGIPVVFGPNHRKFKEAGELMTRGGGFTYANSSEFNALMNSLFNDSSALHNAGDQAGKYIQESIGASDIIYDDIFGQPAAAPKQ